MRRLLLPLLALAVACSRGGGTSDDADTDTAGDADTDADADADADTDADTDADPYFSCGDGPPTTGPWPSGSYDGHPIAVAGSTATEAAYTNDANVDDVVAAAEGEFEDVTVDIDITGAVIVARGYVPENPTNNTLTFWIEDANARAQAFIVDVGMDPNDVSVGDKVSFKATKVLDYFGTTEITEISGFTIESSQNDVHVINGMAGGTLSVENDLLRNVEVWGAIASAGESCGGDYLCYDFDIENSTVAIRSKLDFFEGDCVHMIAPLGSFSGAPQFSTDNFDWFRYY